MTAIVDSPFPSTDTSLHQFWRAIDIFTLLIVLAAASDMLIRMGPAKSLVWLMCYGIILIRVSMLWSQFLPVLLRNAVVFAYPAACAISTLWSLAPLETITASVQILMTLLIATFLGWRYSMTALTKILFVVLASAMALSLLHWATGIFPWPVKSNVGGLLGIFTQKNMLGQRGLFCLAAAVALILMPSDKISQGWKTTAWIGIVITLVAMGLSLSMTSILLIFPTVGLIFLLCLRRLPPVFVALTGLGVVLTVALGPLILSLVGVDPVTAVLNAVGKDATLTGRTLLWDVAVHVQAEAPVLGVGHGAFWHAPQFANERLLVLHAGATSASFHNFILEILVGSGWPGLLAMFSLLAAATIRLYLLFKTTQGPDAAMGLALILMIVVTSVVGASLFRPHEFMLLLLGILTVSAREDLRENMFFRQYPFT